MRSWRPGEAVDHKQPRYTFNFELHGAVVTDRSIRNVHGTYQAGFTTVWGVPINYSGNRWRNAEIVAGVFAGLHEFPAWKTARGAEGPVLIRRERGQPRFTRKAAVGVKLDVNFPVTQDIDFMTSARIASYMADTDYPEPWSLRVGLSIPLGNFAKLVGASSDNN